MHLSVLVAAPERGRRGFDNLEHRPLTRTLDDQPVIIAFIIGRIIIDRSPALSREQVLQRPISEKPVHSVKRACELIADKGGLFNKGDVDHQWTNAEQIRKAYQMASKRLKVEPQLRAKWEASLAVDIEAKKSGRPTSDVALDHRPEWIRGIISKQKTGK